MAIQAATLRFLSDLEKNNDREWFLANKSRYEAALADVRQLASEFFQAWAKVEEFPPQDPAKALFRIYRDVRFSKDKSPYKPWLSFELKRNPGHMGLYVHLQPGNRSLIATGLWEPSKEQLAAARQEIDYNAPQFRKLLSAAKLKQTWGELTGDALKTAPKGYDREDPNLDLLRFKQYMLVRKLKDSEIKSEGIVRDITASFRIAQPFMEFFDAPLRELKKK